MKRFIAILSLVLLTTSLFASLDFSKADKYYDDEEFVSTRNELERLEKIASTNADKSEVYWRLARVYCYLGKTVETDDQRLELYDKGTEYADLSIENKPNGLAYIWKASNYGRIGSIKGALNSLVKASKMRDFIYKAMDNYNCEKSSEGSYVLAELFRQLPGRPFSFGNTNYAISYSRIAVENIPNHVVYPSTYFQLARLLSDRDWDAKYRTKKFKKFKRYYDDENVLHEKLKYYEGLDKGNRKVFYCDKPLSKISDKQEAIYLLEYANKMYDKYPEKRSKEDKENMIEVNELLNKLKK